MGTGFHKIYIPIGSTFYKVSSCDRFPFQKTLNSKLAYLLLRVLPLLGLFQKFRRGRRPILHLYTLFDATCHDVPELWLQSLFTLGQVWSRGDKCEFTASGYVLTAWRFASLTQIQRRGAHAPSLCCILISRLNWAFWALEEIQKKKGDSVGKLGGCS